MQIFLGYLYCHVFFSISRVERSERTGDQGQRLWIGTPEEKYHALNELKSMTGLELSTAKEWSNWWRLRYD